MAGAANAADPTPKIDYECGEMTFTGAVGKTTGYTGRAGTASGA